MCHTGGLPVVPENPGGATYPQLYPDVRTEIGGRWVCFQPNVEKPGFPIWGCLRIDNSGWGVNSSALFDVAGMRWYQRK